MAEEYANIREFLGSFIGKRVLDITQHDEDEWNSGEGRAYVMLMFENGHFVKFYVQDDGIEYTEP